MNSPTRGKVYIVGAGPGNVKLLTVKATEILRKADVVIYDFLVNPKVLDFCLPNCKQIYGGKMQCDQEQRHLENCEQMVKHAEAGEIVVRLKGGDPFLFGRGAEEVLALIDAGIDFEIVPGITSAIAVPTYAGIPVTMRHHASSMAIVTGHTIAEKSIRWKELALAVDTIVILMGVKHLRQITKNLMAAGKSPETPVSLTRWGTTLKQKTIEGNLSDIADKVEKENFQSPAVTVIGNVNNFRNKLQWFDRKALFGKRIVVTRPTTQADRFMELLEENGAEVIHFPTIEIVPIENNLKLREEINRLDNFDWVIFTSTNGVKFFFDELHRSNYDSRSFGKAKICSIGGKTSEALEKFGIYADFVPSKSTSETICDEIGEVRNLKILLPRAKLGNKNLPIELRNRGAIVNDIPVYNTVNTKNAKRSRAIADRLEANKVDMITFTSPSTVANFVEMVDKNLLGKTKISAIGTTTAEAIRSFGLAVDVIPEETGTENFVEAIVKFYTAKF